MLPELPGLVMIHCPGSGAAMCTGVQMTRSDFDAADDLVGDAPCLPCATDHHWTKAEAWLQIDKGTP